MTKHLLLSAAMLAGLAAPALAQKKATAPAPKKITTVEGITEYQLDNGMKVLLFPDPSKPTVTVNITYLVGSRMEGYGETGMAHLLEHMMFKGSTKHTNVPAELTTHGANPNGTTWYDRTNYFETFAGSDENLNWALDLESDRMINSFVAEKDLKSEFTVVRNEFESGENNPTQILEERVLSTAYLWHNYGKSTIGSKEDIEKVPIQNLQAFYHKYYQPDNAVLLVAGKIDEAKTLELVNSYFGSIPRPARKLQPTYTIEPVQDGERAVTLRRTGDVQAASCAYHICNGAHPDYPAVDVLNEVLSNEPDGRLYQALVKPGKASSIYSYAMALKEPGFLYINASVLKDKSLDDAQKTMYATLDELKTKPVTAAEVDKAKSKLLNDFDQVYRNTARVGIALSEFIGQGDWRLGFLYRDGLKKITVADVNRVAGKYLVTDNRTNGTFIPTNNAVRAIIPADPDVEELVKTYKGGPGIAVGEAFDATPENIDKRTETGSMMGGAKYALLSKTTRGNSVVATITLHLGDEGSLRNKATIAELTADMLQRGTRQHTRAQINETLNKLGSKVNINGAGQTVGISISTTRPNLLPTLDLVDEMLHQPSFPAEELKALTDEDLAAYDDERSDPQGIAGRAFGRAMGGAAWPKDHIFYQRTVDEEVAALKAVTLDDLKQFHGDYYNGSSATAAVVGDFDAPAVKQKLEKMLGNWTAVKSYTRIPRPYKNMKAVTEEYKTPDKKNALFLSGEAFRLRDDNPDYAALTMADFMFGGGFLNSRLATRIRQKEGISYGVGTQLQPSSQDENSIYLTYAIYNPENKQKLIDAYKEEIQKVITDGFTEEELKAAKAGIIQYRQTGRANDGALASRLSGNLELGRTMAFSKQLDDALLALTLPQVNATMKKYLKPDELIYIMAGDFK